MRRTTRWILLAGLVMLLALAMCLGPQRTQTENGSGSGSAALGLILLDEAEGVYVLAVTAESAADAAGIQPGDYIVAIGDEPLSAAADLDDISPAGMASIGLTIRRQSQVLHIVLPGK